MTKRYLAALLAVLCAASLSACGLTRPKTSEPEAPSSSASASPDSSEETEPDTTTPGGTARAELDAFKALDLESMNLYTDQESMNLDYSVTEQGLDEQTKQVVQALVANFTYKLGEVVESGDTATVAAELTNADLSGVVGKMIPAMMAEALKSGSVDSTAALAKLAQLMTEAGSRTVSANVTMHLVKRDGTWKVSVDEALADALSGGMIASLKQFSDALGGLADILSNSPSAG